MSAKRQPDRSRFTAWLSSRERQALDDAAEQEGTSANYIVRQAIRNYLGLNGAQVSSLLPVTSDTAARGETKFT